MKKYLLLFILVVQYWTLAAQDFYCKQISINNGLSQSAVTSVTYDGRGALWIGTRFGLNEYRNGKLRSFVDDGSGRILGNYIFFLHTDRRGNLWTSTDKGLFIYDPSADKFILMSDSPVTCAVDSENGIWFGSHFGPDYYSHESGKLVRSNSETYTDYQALYNLDGERILSIDKREGLAIESKDGRESLPLEELGEGLIMASAICGDLLYLSIMNYGLVAYSLSERKAVFSIRSGNDGLPNELMLTLLIHEDSLWMGFDGAGVHTMDLDSHIVEPLERHPGQAGGRIPLSVTCLYGDPHGNVWMGSVRSGMVGLKRSPIRYFEITQSYPSAENVIIDVLYSKDGNVYLGTDGSGVGRYNSVTGIALSKDMEGYKVTSVADYDDYNLVIATYNRGFFLMDRVTSAIRPFVLVDAATNREECFNSNAPVIYNLDDGRILFMAVHAYIYNPRTRRFQAIEDESGGIGTELIPIGKGNGTLYAYSSAGLFSINLENRTLNVIYEPDVETGNVNTAVYHGGLIWFGTNYGLFTFDPRNSRIHKIDSGLFSRVSRLESNGADNLWIAADNSLFLSRNGFMEMTGENRGVPANEILSSTCAPDGTIYLGGTAGLVEIGADCYFSTEENKKVQLRGLSSGRIVLPYNYASLVIPVNLAGADPFERILYRYHLSGMSEASTETFEDSISLPALKSGHYKLDVSYLKSDGTWAAPQDVADIRVRAPWYLSIPMIVFYVLIGLGLIIFSIDRLSRKRIRALEAELRAIDMAFTAKIDAYMDEHLSNPQLSVSEIANHMAMSRATLYHRMNSAFGKGVAEVIEEKRMAKAEELLRSSSMSILEISESVGYSTSRYFSTRFKLYHNGQTPLKYRKASNN